MEFLNEGIFSSDKGDATQAERQNNSDGKKSTRKCEKYVDISPCYFVHVPFLLFRTF